MLVRLLELLGPLRQLPVSASYGLTALIVLAFIGLRLGISHLDASANLPLFLVFIPAVILSAMLFDKGSGFFAVKRGRTFEEVQRVVIRWSNLLVAFKRSCQSASE